MNLTQLSRLQKDPNLKTVLVERQNAVRISYNPECYNSKKEKSVVSKLTSNPLFQLFVEVDSQRDTVSQQVYNINGFERHQRLEIPFDHPLMSFKSRMGTSGKRAGLTLSVWCEKVHQPL